MGTAKGDQNNTTNGGGRDKGAENDQYPEGTRLGHYVLGKWKILCSSFYRQGTR